MKRLVTLCMGFTLLFGSAGMGRFAEGAGSLSEPTQTYIVKNLNKTVWYGIYIKNKKFGYASFAITKDEKRNYIIHTITTVINNKEKSINNETIINDIIKTVDKYYFNLSTGSFLKCSSEFPGSAASARSATNAMVVDEFLVVQKTFGTKTKLPWNNKNFNLEKYFSEDIWLSSNPEIGSGVTGVILECGTGELEKFESKLIKIEEVLIGGKKEKKYIIRGKFENLGEFVGTALADGTPIEISVGPMKMFFESKMVAQSNLNFINLHEATSLKINKPINDYEKLSLLKLKISSSSPAEIKNSFQQLVKKNEDGSHSIVLGPKTQFSENFDSDAYETELKGTARYPIKSPTITALVKEILKGAKTENEKIWRLLAFVSNTLIDDYLANSTDALQILSRHRGDCTEHAILFVTLARAAEIPAREVSGLVYNGIDKAPGFGGHVWVEVALDGKWVGLDPTWRKRVMAPIRIKISPMEFFKINKIEIEEKAYRNPVSSENKKLANIAYEEKDYKKSFSLFRPLAEKGDAYSQYSLGWAFEQGKGVSKDYKKAYRWYLKAAQQGHSGSEYRIGQLYTDEKRLGNDPTRAAFWFERSALGGNDHAAYYLAEAYETGAGMPKNKDKAIEWYKSAASSVFF